MLNRVRDILAAARGHHIGVRACLDAAVAENERLISENDFLHDENNQMCFQMAQMVEELENFARDLGLDIAASIAQSDQAEDQG